MTGYININFPFRDSNKGFFLDLTSDDASAIKADLMHLILTKKGERFYLPEFGTNLLRYIFEPEDGLTLGMIEDEIKTSVSKYLPKLQITNIAVTQSTDNNHAADVRIDYNVTDDVFTSSDFVIISI